MGSNKEMFQYCYRNIGTYPISPFKPLAHLAGGRSFREKKKSFVNSDLIYSYIYLIFLSLKILIQGFKGYGLKKILVLYNLGIFCFREKKFILTPYTQL